MRNWSTTRHGQSKGKGHARTEQTKTRAELAETRIAQIEHRVEHVEARVEHAETMLQYVVHKENDLRQEISKRIHHHRPTHGIADQGFPLDRLTGRQRQVLQLIAAGHNTKQIGEIINISPKTVEYHRMRLMHCLNVYDIPGLVRFALRVGLISHES